MVRKYVDRKRSVIEIRVPKRVIIGESVKILSKDNWGYETSENFQAL